MRKVVALLSGGLDSTVLCASLRSDGWDVLPLSIAYGQRHRARELESALAVAGELGLRTPTILEVPALRGSSLTGSGPIPHGHYADDSMRSTVVPNRNMIFLAHAAAHAIAEGAEAVAYAAHAGDHAVYPDCRPAFVAAMAAALAVAHYRPIELLTPFVAWSKAEIAAAGARLGAPLDLTWSCYEGGPVHCGRCGTCVERREAFQLAGVDDPTLYAEEVRP